MNASPACLQAPHASSSLLALLGVLAVLLPLRPALATPAEEEDLTQWVGDFEVAVSDQVFGFLVQDGRLHLKMGGVDGGGSAVPLIREEPGRFVIQPGHPNAFDFRIEDGEVVFTLYAMGNAIAGKRVGAAQEQGAAATNRGTALDERTRSDVLAALVAAAAAHRSAPDDAAQRLAYGRLLFQTGDFGRAQEVVAPLVETADADAEALDLAGDLAYLRGDYGAAETIYRRLLARRADDPAGRVGVLVDLMFVYYQTNRFADVAELEFPAGAQLPTADLMRTFDAPPYRLTWDEEPLTHLPFVVTDPLPVFIVEVNGVPIHVILDTGADMLILDTELAQGLSVEWLAQATGNFAGGLTHEIGFGKVENVRLGDATLHGVPVTLLPTKRFTATFDTEAFVVGGIVGTATLRQFLATIDYAEERLVLRERSAAVAAAVRDELAGHMAAQVPFVLAATHLMMARGGADGTDGLTFFIDSGLASEAAFVAPEQTLAELDIARPPTAISEEGEGGGGKVATGLFPLDRLRLGSLEQRDIRGVFGPLTPDSYWARGFIQDGLLSHRFLRRYASWTLDFDAMEFLIADSDDRGD